MDVELTTQVSKFISRENIMKAGQALTLDSLLLFSVFQFRLQGQVWFKMCLQSMLDGWHVSRQFRVTVSSIEGKCMSEID